MTGPLLMFRKSLGVGVNGGKIGCDLIREDGRLAIEVPLSRKTNWVTAYLVVASLCLTTLGLVMLFSAGAVRGAQDLLSKQTVWLLLSLGAGAYMAYVDLKLVRRFTPLLFGLCILGLVLTLLPGIGVKVNGAQRWIGSLTNQPSNLPKLIGSVVLVFCFEPKRITGYPTLYSAGSGC